MTNNKRGLSLMISYVLLIVITIAIGVTVYAYLKLYLPSAKTECPADMSLGIEDISCSSTSNRLTFTIINQGLFNVGGAFVRFGEEGRTVRNQLNPNKETFASALSPGNRKPFAFNITRLSSPTNNYILEVQPAIIKDRKLVPCSNVIITQEVSCNNTGLP